MIMMIIWETNQLKRGRERKKCIEGGQTFTPTSFEGDGVQDI